MKPSDFKAFIGLVLDDNLDVPIRRVLEFEKALASDDGLEVRGVYRDWLDEYGCVQRAAVIDAWFHALKGKLEMKALGLSEEQQQARDEQRCLLLPYIREFQVKPPLLGIPVLRHPAGMIQVADGSVQSCQDFAREFMSEVQSGCITCLPNTRDIDTREYLWEFRVEGGPPDQVNVTRRTQ